MNTEKRVNETRNEVSSEMNEAMASKVKWDVNELKRKVDLCLDGLMKAKTKTEFDGFFWEMGDKLTKLKEAMPTEEYSSYRTNYVDKRYKNAKQYYRFDIPKKNVEIQSKPKDPSEQPICTSGLEAALRKLSEANTKEDRDEWLELIENWFVEVTKKYVRLKEDRTAEIEEIRKITDQVIEAVKNNYLTNDEEEETDPERKLNLQIRDLIWNLDSVEKVNQLAELFKQKCSQRQLNELYQTITDHMSDGDVKSAAYELYKNQNLKAYEDKK